MQGLPNFQLGGFATNVISQFNKGYSGAYWTSTAAGAERAWNMSLYTDGSGSILQETLYKPTGISVRCVAN
jgi:hypothetical protein